MEAEAERETPCKSKGTASGAKDRPNLNSKAAESARASSSNSNARSRSTQRSSTTAITSATSSVISGTHNNYGAVVKVMEAPAGIANSDTKSKLSNIGIFNNLSSIVRLYAFDGTKRDRISLFLCLLLFFLANFDLLNIATLDSLFQMHKPLCWDASHIGYYAFVSQGACAIAGMIYQSVSEINY